MFLLCSIPIKYRAEGCFHRFSWKLWQLLNLEMALFVHSTRSGLFLSMDEHTGRHRKKKPHMLWANSRGKTSILWNIIQFLLNLWFCWILYQFCFVNFDEYFCFFNFVEYFLLISGWRKTLLPHQMVQVRSLKNLWSFSLKLYPRDITNWGKKKLRQGGKRDQNQPLLKVQIPFRFIPAPDPTLNSTQYWFIKYLWACCFWIWRFSLRILSDTFATIVIFGFGEF